MIQPLKGRVLVRKTIENQTNSAGIEIVETAKTTRPSTISRGTVEAVHPETTPPDIEPLTVGLAVIFNEGWGNEIEPGVFLVETDDIKAVIL